MCSFNINCKQNFLQLEEADGVLESLEKINFHIPTYKKRGRELKSKRSIAVFGGDGLAYNFTGTEIIAQPWSPLLLEILDQVERETGYTYNLALITRFADGSEYIPQHKGDSPLVIASFGEVRTLAIKRSHDINNSIKLEHGSLCIVESPANEVYTFGVPPELNKKALHIHIQFMNTSKTIPIKKPRLDSTTVDGWLSDVFAPPMMPPPITQWDLGGNVFVQVRTEKDSLRLHIRKFIQREDGTLSPTKNGIVMLSSTWSDFKNKLYSYDFSESYIFKKDLFNGSLVLNKQLLVIPLDNETCILQQMFDTKVNGFYLKPCILKLSKPQLFKLQNYMSEISNYLIQTHLTILFPNLILKQGEICFDHFESEIEAEDFLMTVIQNYIDLELNCLYPCYACNIASTSLFDHECSVKPFEERFFLFRDRILMTLNLHKIVEHLCGRCMCYYTESFLSRFEFPHLNEYLKSCKEDIE